MIQPPLGAFRRTRRAVRGGAYGAASPVATGVSGAFVDLDLAAGACEAGPAGTGVAALASVATSGSIHAGLVVGAVVEVWTDTAAHVDEAAAGHPSLALIWPWRQLLSLCHTFCPLSYSLH